MKRPTPTHLCTALAAVFLVVSATQAQPEYLPPPKATLGQPVLIGSGLDLPELIRMALDHNPQLQQAGADIAAAQGKALQAGLHPNPTLWGSWDELGDPQGGSGIVTLPQFTQEIVTGGKLKLSRAVAQQETDIAGLALARKRIELITDVRKKFFAVLALQRRADLLQQQVDVFSKSYETAEKLKNAKQLSELDLIQFQLELHRAAAKLDVVRQELFAGWHQLIAAVGGPQLPCTPLVGSLDLDLPDSDYFALRSLMLERHPSRQMAHAGIIRAQTALRRAEVEKIPNVTVGAGYTRQNQNKGDDWMVAFSLPIPVFNRNQGNIQAARAEVTKALQEVNRTENELAGQLAVAYGAYMSALKQVQRYRTTILKDVHRAHELTVTAHKKGQLDYMKVLETQKAITEINLEYLQVLSQAWQGASEIAGLTVAEDWLLGSSLPHAK